MEEYSKVQHREEHVLVCLSSSPSNAHIIQCAANMASAFGGGFTALYVQTPDAAYATQENQKRLQENMEYAQRKGAQIEQVFGEDIPFQIAEYARLSGVTRIVIGRSAVPTGLHLPRKTLVDQLLDDAGDIDIHIIPDMEALQEKHRGFRIDRRMTFNLKDSATSVMMIFAATCLGLLFSYWGLSDANVITIYILSVLLIALMTANYIYYVASSFLAVIVFNFLFTDPKYTLWAYDAGYPFTFVVMFIVSCITGNLAYRLKVNAKQNAQAAYRTKILFDTEQMIAKVSGEESITDLTARQLMKLLKKNVILYREVKGKLEKVKVYQDGENADLSVYDRKEERDAAEYTFLHNTQSGAQTDRYPDIRCHYYAIRMNAHVFGVIGIDLEHERMDPLESSILLSVLGECALALQNERNAQEKAAASLAAENEKTKANLLRSISHDLRTPLTTISGNADNLMKNGDAFDAATLHQIYEDIYDDALWLNQLVENVLSISRVEDGTIQLRTTTELLEECVQEALGHLDRNSEKHRIVVHEAEEVLLVKVETRLMVQVIINLVNNAIKYTQEGSCITLDLYEKDRYVCLDVADDGPGIKDSDKEHIFEMFYTSKKKAADSHRSLGLGLALCRSIISAHGGMISVRDNVPKGTVFTVALPKAEVEYYE